MIQSNFKFKEINGRLSLSDPFLEGKFSSFKCYNKFIGFFLKLFGKAQDFEAQDLEGNSKRWIINKNSFDKWQRFLPSQGESFDDRIGSLIQNVKVEQNRLQNSLIEEKGENKEAHDRTESDEGQKTVLSNNLGPVQESLENEEIVSKNQPVQGLKPLRYGFYNPGRCCFLMSAIHCLSAIPDSLPNTSEDVKGQALLEMIQKSNERVCSEEEVIEIRSKFASKNGRVPEFSADPRQGADINSTYQFFHDILKMPKFLATPHLDNSELGDPLLNSYLTVDIQNMDQRLSLSDLISKDIGRLTPLKQKSTDVQKIPYRIEIPDFHRSDENQQHPKVVPICLLRNKETDHSPIEVPANISFYGNNHKYELIACGMVSDKVDHAYAFIKENGTWIKYDNEYSFVCKNEQKVLDEIEKHAHLLIYRPI